LGHLGFQTYKTENFVSRAIQYNGRRVAADAYYLQRYEVKKEKSQKWVEGGTSYKTVYTNDRTFDASSGTWKNSNGMARVPVEKEGHYEEVTKWRRTVNAVMIAFLDIEVFGYFGFHFINIENGDGVLITSVTYGSPADEAGIRQGDRMLSIGGRDVVSYEDFHSSHPVYQPGKSEEIVLLRDGKQIALDLAPVGHKELLRLQAAVTGYLGFDYEEVKAGGGLEILKVHKGSPAGVAGLKVGDILLGIDSTEMPTRVQLEQFRLVPGKQIEVEVKRMGKTVQVMITPVTATTFNAMVEAAK